MSPGGGVEPTYKGCAGLAEDVQYYGELLKSLAYDKLKHLYPKAKLPNGQEATVIAWIWARTVKCPNPACGCQMPLVKSWELSKKKGKEAYIEPHFCKDHFEYEVKQGICKQEGTVERTGAKCLHCGTPVPFDYIRNESKQHRLSNRMLAIVAEGDKGRYYLTPTCQHEAILNNISIPDNYPNGELSGKAKVNVGIYGLTHTADLFTPRQLTALTTFSDLINEVYDKVLEDVEKIENSGIENSVVENSNGAPQNYFLFSNPLFPKQYARAIATYLAFVVDKLADWNSTICGWNINREGIRDTFGRQAIPMTWDFAEVNVFSNSSGSYNNMLESVIKNVAALSSTKNSIAINHDAQTDCGLRNIMISTDPPYYDNIGYADLSDYFYVWMRRSLKQYYPDIFKTMLVPKAEELVATPYRFDGSKEKAKSFFEDGMFHTCEQLYKYSREDIPVTIYYAYKQSDNNERDKTSSSGWETMLSAIVKSGFQITGTWPMETERDARNVAIDTNALASSIVLVCRKRPQDAPVCSLRDFQKALSKDLRPALQKMQSSSIAPVDLAQSAIGPGMAVFSRYSAVLRSDDTPVTIREALELINKEIDIVFNEQDQAFDAETRFCLTIFAQYGFNDMKFGEANTLANAKNTSVERVAALGAVYSAKGTVYLYPIDELPSYESAHADCVWTLTHHLVKTILSDGIAGCVSFIAKLNNSHNLIHCKELSYRLYTACERAKHAKLAIGYNALVTAWDEIMRGVSAQQSEGKQGTLGF